MATNCFPPSPPDGARRGIEEIRLRYGKAVPAVHFKHCYMDPADCERVGGVLPLPGAPGAAWSLGQFRAIVDFGKLLAVADTPWRIEYLRYGKPYLPPDVPRPPTDGRALVRAFFRESFRREFESGYGIRCLHGALDGIAGMLASLAEAIDPAKMPDSAADCQAYQKMFADLRGLYQAAVPPPASFARIDDIQAEVRKIAGRHSSVARDLLDGKFPEAGLPPYRNPSHRDRRYEAVAERLVASGDLAVGEAQAKEFTGCRREFAMLACLVRGPIAFLQVGECLLWLCAVIDVMLVDRMPDGLARFARLAADFDGCRLGTWRINRSGVSLGDFATRSGRLADRLFVLIWDVNRIIDGLRDVPLDHDQVHALQAMLALELFLFGSSRQACRRVANGLDDILFRLMLGRRSVYFDPATGRLYLKKVPRKMTVERFGKLQYPKTRARKAAAKKA